MVEGDGCHRVARDHRRELVGRKFVSKSPNGRFKAGAKAIMNAGGVLIRIEVHGKNLFYFFGTAKGPATVVVHIHFGMAGAFATYKREAPETTANTRLLLESTDGEPKILAHLSAMTVEHGTIANMYDALAAKLGPDPLREDADPMRFVEKCSTAKKPIGTVLMDQSFMAGVGNIYRSETLYEAGIHPSQMANTVTKNELLKLWAVIVKQMQAGFKTGSIWGNKHKPFCYGQTKSACGGKVKEWELAGRTVYACAKNQLLDSKRPPVAPISVKTGTAHIKKMSPAVVAEEKKRKTGEGLAVQHVALKDDATRAAALRAAAKKKASSKKRPVDEITQTSAHSAPPMKKRRT